MTTRKPKSIMAVYDNIDTEQATCDHFVVVMKDHYYHVSGQKLHSGFTLSDNSNSAQGVSQHGDVIVGPHLGKKIAWSRLPQVIQDHVIARLTKGEG